MAVAIVQTGGLSPMSIRFVANATNDTSVPSGAATAATGASKPADPSPLEIVPKEIIWAGGCFLVLLVLMRWVLYPRVAAGMEERTKHIRSNHDEAERDRDQASAEKSQYEAQLVGVRAEANRRLDAARAQVEQERQTALADLNARLSQRRQAALAELAAARAAAAGQVASATTDVVSHAASLVLGRTPDADIVRRAVTSSMNGGAQ